MGTSVHSKGESFINKCEKWPRNGAEVLDKVPIKPYTSQKGSDVSYRPWDGQTRNKINPGLIYLNTFH